MCEQCRSAAITAARQAQARRQQMIAAASSPAAQPSPVPPGPAGNPSARIGSVRPPAAATTAPPPETAETPAVTTATQPPAQSTAAESTATTAGEHVIEITVDIDPDNPASADDVIKVYAEDGSFSASKTVRDDVVAGDNRTTLRFTIPDPGIAYTIEVDPGAEGQPYTLMTGYSPATPLA